MADLSGGLTAIVNLVLAAGGLGTAAMGLVDASKAFWGGPSNFGFGHIASALKPFLVALDRRSSAPDKWPRVADFMKRAFLGQPQTWP